MRVSVWLRPVNRHTVGTPIPRVVKPNQYVLSGLVDHLRLVNMQDDGRFADGSLGQDSTRGFGGRRNTQSGPERFKARSRHPRQHRRGPTGDMPDPAGQGLAINQILDAQVDEQGIVGFGFAQVGRKRSLAATDAPWKMRNKA